MSSLASSGAGPPPRPPVPRRTTVSTAANRSSRERLEILRSLDDGSGILLTELAAQFLQQTTATRASMAGAADTRDAAALIHDAHLVRGAASNIGASTLADVCAEVERCAADGHLDEVASLLLRFDEEFERVRGALGDPGCGAGVMKVLVADDDPTNRLILERIVSRLGHDCTVTGDGNAAWAHLQDHPVDVLLTDWMMPGVEGPELCRRLRSDPAAPYVYVVLITSLSDRDQVLAGMDAGADDYLAKPVDPFQVETRLIAARRVTHLHSEIKAYRDALEVANLELLDESRTDPLTGLGNRRLMERDLALVLARARRHEGNFSVAMIDVDTFKAYNDEHGHAAGDDALRAIAHAIARSCRVEDTAYRYGGEEFLLVLQDTALTDALAAVDRIRHAVEAAAMPHTGSTHKVLTISAGVAAWSVDGSLTELLDVADHALYRAKRSGRNRVAGPAPGMPEGTLARPG